MPVVGALRAAGRRYRDEVLPPACRRRASRSRRRLPSAGSAGSAREGGPSASTASAPRRRARSLFAEFGFTVGQRVRARLAACSPKENDRDARHGSKPSRPAPPVRPEPLVRLHQPRARRSGAGSGGMVDETGSAASPATRPSSRRPWAPATTTTSRSSSDCAARGSTAAAIFDRLAVEDVRVGLRRARARVPEQRRRGRLRLHRGLAGRRRRHASCSIDEAHRLFAAVDRPNVMVKIPGTKAGVPGHPAVPRGRPQHQHHAAVLACRSTRRWPRPTSQALEWRLQHDHTVRAVSSVASFFVSRVDTLVDKLLDERIEAAADAAERRRLEDLKGKAGVANSKVVYERFRSYLNGRDWQLARRLRRQGAARALGQHRHQEPGLLRRAVRRRAHRRAHRQHHARRRPGTPSRTTACWPAPSTGTSTRPTGCCAS